MATHEEILLDFERVTPADRHSYFGYYDKFPWDVTGRYLLALEPSFIDRPPTGDDVVRIGMVDLQDNKRWIPLAESRAWNWQQGIMLHWLHTDPECLIIYNDREGDRFVSKVMNVFNGKTRTLPRPVYCIRPDGKQALSVNFARIARTRPGYGYEGLPDPGKGNPAPEDDGIWAMDLETGENKLIISLAQAASLSPKDNWEGCEHWFNHLQYCTDGSRFLFLHRWKRPDGNWRETRLLTAKPDGSDVRIIADDGMTSHFDWKDERRILAWARLADQGDHFYLFDAVDRRRKPGRRRSPHVRRALLVLARPALDSHRHLSRQDASPDAHPLQPGRRQAHRYRPLLRRSDLRWRDAHGSAPSLVTRRPEGVPGLGSRERPGGFHAAHVRGRREVHRGLAESENGTEFAAGT